MEIIYYWGPYILATAVGGVIAWVVVTIGGRRRSALEEYQQRKAHEQVGEILAKIRGDPRTYPAVPFSERWKRVGEVAAERQAKPRMVPRRETDG